MQLTDLATRRLNSANYDEYDYRGYQCLTIADDGAYILLSQGEKIFKIDTSTAWGGVRQSGQDSAYVEFT